LSEINVQLVVNNGDVIGVNFIKIHDFLDRLATEIHKTSRLDGDHSDFAYAAGAE